MPPLKFNLNSLVPINIISVYNNTTHSPHFKQYITVKLMDFKRIIYSHGHQAKFYTVKYISVDAHNFANKKKMNKKTHAK